MNRVAVLGVGVIGGSLCLAWKRHRPDLFLIGHDRPEVLDAAARRGLLDARALDPVAAVRDADLVVLAVPLVGMLRLLEVIAPHLRPGTLVTDVGSVKTPVLEQAEAVLPASVTFIGGHPMAGSERGGIAHADAFLFENATYVLCPARGADAGTFLQAHPAFLDLIRATGAHVLVLGAARHDHIAAAVSHLPQLLAVALMHDAAAQHAEDDAFLRLAAGGFRDMTRIAASPFALWRDILLANQGPILDALGRFATTLQRLRNRLIEEDWEALAGLFSEARRLRETIPKDTKGFLHPLADVYVYAEDRPGELLGIVRTLFEAELNLKDVELLKVREGTGGAFRISLADDEAAAQAVSALHRGGYEAYRL